MVYAYSVFGTAFFLGTLTILSLTTLGNGNEVENLSDKVGIPSQAFVWASDEMFINNGRVGKVSYAGVSVYELARDLVSSVFASGSSESRNLVKNEMKTDVPDYLIAVVGNQLRADAVGEATRGAMQGVGLQAGAWTVFQQVFSNADNTPSLSAQLVASAVSDNKPLVSGSCDGVDSSLVELVEGGVTGMVVRLKDPSTAGSVAKLILVCIPEDYQMSESASLEMIAAAATASGKRYLALYISEASAPALSLQAAGANSMDANFRRGLIESDLAPESAPDISGKIHDELFYLQADLLKSLLVVLFSVIPLLAGLCCLMSLDTPTKFESTKIETVY
eukprot:CAMPEP_0196577466 /NCGR_PEP_ID=MMETSP1081-20130531/6535_1 /TAXON_ID=36882 /ORGANISM="Pyramimonas amylifera, Strain CCMP720" /LENGTH=334 /DNA_ID=CAMNT_0041896401 /DNA_START=104 /DNA_END=1108 /DNA_ORIENTATION=+